MKNLFAAALCALALVAVALAEDKETKREDSKDADQVFVTKASQAGLAEVKLGNMAAKNASAGAVKKFGQKMVDDHDKANKELADLAGKKKLKVAERIGSDHAKVAEKLGKLEGSEFDKAYMEGQVKDHVEAVALFEKQAKDGKDEDLKEWARKTLPHLKEHLKMAREINGDLGGKRKEKREEK